MCMRNGTPATQGLATPLPVERWAFPCKGKEAGLDLVCISFLEPLWCTPGLLLARLAPSVSGLAGGYCVIAFAGCALPCCLSANCAQDIVALHLLPFAYARSWCRRRARRASTASPAIRRLRSLSGRGHGRPATRRRPGGPPAGHAPVLAPGTGPSTMATGISRARIRARTTTALFSWATSRTIPTRTRCATSLRRMDAWRLQRCACA